MRTVLYMGEDASDVARLERLLSKQSRWHLTTCARSEGALRAHAQSEGTPNAVIVALRRGAAWNQTHARRCRGEAPDALLVGLLERWDDGQARDMLRLGLDVCYDRRVLLSPALTGLLDALVQQHLDERARRDQQAHIQDDNRRLTLLNALAASLNSARQPRDIAQHTLDTLAPWLDNGVAAFYAWRTSFQRDPQGLLRGESERVRALERIAAYNLPPATPSGQLADPLSPTWLQRQPGFEAAIHTSLPQPLPAALVALRPTRADLDRAFIVPLGTHNNALGALVLASPSPAPGRDATERALMEGVGHYVGAALENAELFHDIEHAYASLKDTNAQLVQSEKLAAVGMLAAGIAHEINNPASFVITNLSVTGDYVDTLLAYTDRLEQLARAHPGGADACASASRELDMDFVRADLTELMSRSLRGMRRIHNIVRDLRVFAHEDTQQPQWVQLPDVLASAVTLIQGELRGNATLRRVYDDVGAVRTWPNRLGQVVLNLLVNACHASDSARPNVITLRTRLLDPQDPDHGVCVEIHDTGCGINEADLPRIFEPFFTTKPVGSGTGLGLAMSYDIVRKLRGTIDVDSQPGVGSRFTLTLPRDVTLAQLAPR